MAVDERDGDGTFLRRWSQRKLAASRQGAAGAPAAVAAPAAPASVAASAAPAMAPVSPAPVSPVGSAPAPGGAGDVSSALPPVDSLRFDSDFTRFLAPQVDEVVKRQALRKLFSDPRFNVMDGLDVYIDDYSKFEPIPDDLIGKLRHARYIFDPPKTRVNEAGHVEDVADEAPAGAVAGVDGDGDAGGQDAVPATEQTSEPPVAAPGAAAPDAEAQDAARAGTAAGDDARVPPAADVVERKGTR
jgi:hypothetical protein